VISVLLPVRDAEATLPACIASLEAQRHDDFEVLAVDDGSRDGSREVLHAWAARDPRVRVLTADGRGIVAALETARAAAGRPYLARMDADDVAHPERFALQLACLEAEPALAGCGCHVRYVPPERVRDGARRYQAWLNAIITPDDVAREIFVECPLAHPTFFLRADAVEAVGGYRDPGWAEDYDLVLRLWRAGRTLAVVPSVLLDWTERPDRLSRTDPRYAPEAFRRCKVHHLRHTLLDGRKGLVVWGAGPVGKAFAREARAQGVRLRAFVDIDPRKIGQTVYGVPVLGPEELQSVEGSLVAAAVGREGAREEIRSALSGAGWCEGVDFVAVA